jgi:predicted nucleic acid-binding protein
VIGYLIDSSALWRVMRDEELSAAWSEIIEAGAICSCDPQRAEFRRSARNLREYDEMVEMFDDLYPDAPVPKHAWRWIDSAQYRLVHRGTHRSLSVTDLLVAATAAHHGLVLLHDDKDFVTAARHLKDVTERRVIDLPQESTEQD